MPSHILSERRKRGNPFKGKSGTNTRLKKKKFNKGRLQRLAKK